MSAIHYYYDYALTREENYTVGVFIQFHALPQSTVHLQSREDKASLLVPHSYDMYRHTEDTDFFVFADWLRSEQDG